MLDSNNAKRKEFEIVANQKGKYKRPIWIFNCDCGKELRVQKGSLEKHSGKCVACVKRKRHPLRTLYNCFLASVRRTNKKNNRKIQIDISFDEFLQFTQIEVCHYCGGAVKWNEWKAGPYNLDRKNSDEDYVLSNIVVCCFPCNRMKGAFFSYSEFMAISYLLKAWKRASEDEKQELICVLQSFHDRLDFLS